MRELADDIKQNGLQSPITVASIRGGGLMLLDGRNRLDALALLGLVGPPLSNDGRGFQDCLPCIAIENDLSCWSELQG